MFLAIVVTWIMLERMSVVLASLWIVVKTSVGVATLVSIAMTMIYILTSTHARNYSIVEHHKSGTRTLEKYIFNGLKSRTVTVESVKSRHMFASAPHEYQNSGTWLPKKAVSQPHQSTFLEFIAFDAQ